MTQEEKARAYDEVVNKLRRFMAQGVDPLITRDDVQDFFPELAESEDEKIRKALKEYFINSFQNNGVAAVCGVHIKDILAFLEKQSKDSPVLSNSSNIGKDEQKSAWKPTDEQMEYLAKAIVILGDGGDCKTASILNYLRVELKKLRDE